jgi:hypothetical protein
VTSEWIKYKFGLNQHCSIFLFAGLAWAIWNVRNKMTMQSKCPNRPVEVLFHGISNLQKWNILLRKDEREKMKKILDKLLLAVKTFRASTRSRFDVMIM